jgi:hypothetical protein
MSDLREALEAERAELIAENEAATSWGAAVGARSERIREIDSALAALSGQPQPEAEAVAWRIRVVDGSYCKVIPEGELDIWKQNWSRHLASGHAILEPLGVISTAPPLAPDERMRRALAPFVQTLEHDISKDETDEDIFRPMSSGYNRAPLITVGDLRRIAALSGAADASNASAEARPPVHAIAAKIMLGRAILSLKRFVAVTHRIAHCR